MAQQSLEARLVELESQVARNERTIEELNEIVRRQGEGIDAFKAELEVLRKAIRVEAELDLEPEISREP